MVGLLHYNESLKGHWHVIAYVASPKYVRKYGIVFWVTFCPERNLQWHFFRIVGAILQTIIYVIATYVNCTWWEKPWDKSINYSRHFFITPRAVTIKKETRN